MDKTCKDGLWAELRKPEARPHTLGKRGIQEAEIEVGTETGGQMGKRGRCSVEFQTTEAAGVQENPCQAK